MLGRIKSEKFLILTLLLVVLLALAVRAGIICNTVGGEFFGGETAVMGEVARNVVEGQGYVVDWEYVSTIRNLQKEEYGLVDVQDLPRDPRDEQFTPYYGRPPGTIALLAGTYWAFGEYRYIYLRVIQAIIDSLGCLLMFLIGRELFGRRVGLISAFLYAVYLPIAYLSTWPLLDALMPFITLVSLYFFVKAVRKRAMKFYILSALFAGISCYFQPSALLLPLVFGLGLFIYQLRKTDFRQHVAHVAKMTAVMMGVLVLVVSPWMARNYHTSGGAFLNMRVGVWQVIWEGFGEFENPVGAVFDDTITCEQVREEVGYHIECPSPELDAVLRGKVLNTIREYPGWWLSIAAKRVPRIVFYLPWHGMRYYPRDDQGNFLWSAEERREAYPHGGYFITAAQSGTFWEYVKSHPYGAFDRGLAALISIVSLLLSMVGIWVMRRNWRTLVLVATLPVYFSVIHMFLMMVVHKSLVPGSLAYIIFSAIALDYFYTRIRGARRKTDKLTVPPN